MKNLRLKSIIVSMIGLAIALAPVATGAVTTLGASCAGVSSTSSITWTATSTGGVLPVAFLWGNSSTSPVQTISVVPGLYSMTLQATDASSTVATATCSATVAQSAPTITSFVATPSTITVGQSSVLSFVVTNASSTSIDNGVGTITGTSVTVTPTVTTTYQLSAVNPNGTVTLPVVVTVNPVSTGDSIQAQIRNLLNQIANMRAQLMQLLQQQHSGDTANSTPPVPVKVGTCDVFKRDLSRGDKGDDVRELQRNLAKDTSIFQAGNITGVFGRKTEEALKKFQRKHGIFSVGTTTTGFFGKKTRGFFLHNCVGLNGTTIPLLLNSNHDKNDDRGENHGGGKDN